MFHQNKRQNLGKTNFYENFIVRKICVSTGSPLENNAYADFLLKTQIVFTWKHSIFALMMEHKATIVILKTKN